MSTGDLQNMYLIASSRFIIEYIVDLIRIPFYIKDFQTTNGLRDESDFFKLIFSPKFYHIVYA